MAELIATVAVSSILSKLTELLTYRLHREETREIESLRTEIKLTEEFISEKSKEYPLQHDVLGSLRELSYDMDDILDSFIVNVRHKRGESLFRRLGHINERRNLYKQIRKLKDRATELRGRRSRFAIPRMGSGPLPDDPRVAVMSKDPRVAVMSKEASGHVGMDRPRAEVTKLLLVKGESESPLKAVSIVGLGGVGKTTLAKEVYNATKEYFECRAWVTVSQNPSMEKFLIDILCQVEDPHSSGSKGDGERDLISSTNKSLQGKRYLIVLDDLWSTGTLEIIKLALPLNNFGSRVIVTTRNLSVAQACCSYWNGHIYNILPLSSEDSWMLFNRRIFGEDPCPSELVDVAEKILGACFGMPLAIDCMSSLLASKPRSRAAWEHVLNSIASTSESLHGVAKAPLLFSFNDLPPHLRLCLLYLSIFPEDYPVKCDRIVRCWISEGFVLGNSKTTPDEVGQSYLTELINRSLIQPVRYDGKLEAIRIHDMVLDLIRSISTKENFVSILDKLSSPETVLDGNFRRLSIINTNEDNCNPESVGKSPIRSLFIFGRVGLNISFEHFTLLRVLDMEGCKDLSNHHIIEITKLFLLRFLSIRDTPIRLLPYQIGRLQLLRTLDLRGTEVQELPTGIVQLQMLAHLLCDKMRFPEGIEKMAALSCLSQLDILRSKLSVRKELGKLSELRELELWWSLDRESNNTEVYEDLAKSLDQLSKLQSLCIRGDDISVDLLDHLQHPLNKLKRIQLNNSCYLNRIPSWFRSLASLEYACIDIKEVKNEDLWLLSELSELLHLSLSSRDIPTEKLVIGGNGFTVLREFHLHSAKIDLTFELEAMQKLHKLVVSSDLHPAQICGTENLSKGIKIDIGTSQVSQEATTVAIRKAADEQPKHTIVHTVELGDVDDYAAKERKVEQNLKPIKDYEAKEGDELEQNLEMVKGKRLEMI